MKGFKWVIVVIITLITIYVTRWIPGFQITSAGNSGYVTWLYIEMAENNFIVTDLGGTPIPDGSLIAHKNDTLVFVNRTDATVDVSFDSANIFGASNRMFSIDSLKRKPRKIVGPPNASGYSYSIKRGQIIVNPPKVRVGEDP